MKQPSYTIDAEAQRCAANILYDAMAMWKLPLPAVRELGPCEQAIQDWLNERRKQ